MKTIILFRHGKSDWDANYGQDHERPLARRGIKAASKMGMWLRSTAQVPDHLFSSSAVRARTTLALAKAAGEWPGDIHIVNELYDATVEAYLHGARQTPETAESVILTGHEPTCSMTTSMLSGGGMIQFPTATMARIDLDIDSWEDVGNRTGRLVWLVSPKSLDKSGF